MDSNALADLREAFKSGKTRSLVWRRSQLLAVRALLTENEQALAQALFEDLRKPIFEACGLEILATVKDVDLVLEGLEGWLAPQFVPVPALTLPATHEIIYQPYGVCLIMSPFNYPINLTLAPLIGCIAAGNVAVVKPSELCTSCETLLQKLFIKYLDPECIKIVTGDASVGAALLELKWDFILYTGSTRIGSVVALAAAKNLTPYVLELGGKSPTYVDESATDLALVARRVIWGRMCNMGQTCICPDYVIVHEHVYESFVKHALQSVKDFYGDHPQTSKDLARIISPHHCERIQRLLTESGGTVLCGGEIDLADKYVAPTLLADLSPDCAVMKEEIFGPVLPVFKVSSVNEAVSLAQRVMENPLVSYVFGKNKAAIQSFIDGVPSGDVVVNDTMFHVFNSNAPFGGVGNSGSGKYHGKFSIEAFSFKRTIMRRDDHSVFDISLRYPPYSKLALQVFQFGGMVPDVPPLSFPSLTTLGWYAVIGVLAVYIHGLLPVKL